ncbi:MAG TPA: D-alanyl-D-alanine carboxypeptidase [Streptosporangiaceae bacterium]|nr:D-alanyl-D-alanine carboxypeptidase [Streptosporangiaceae bacterium]
MTALLVSGAAVFLARTSSTHPPTAAQVHSPGQASPGTRGGSLTQTASRTQAAAGTQTFSARQAVSAAQAALAVAGGPSQVMGAALANAATGKVLWSVAANTERPIGSIVKIMTALVVIQAGDLNREITVPRSVIAYLKSQDGPSTAGLIVGDRLTTLELLEALLLPSGCDAAYTLALAYGPGIGAFIAKMNTEAQRLGLTGTHFSNFDGMPWPSEYSTWSTPANLITLGRRAMSYPVFAAIVGQASYSLPAGDGHHSYSWQNTNPLIGAYPGAAGIKTGDTKAAGNCLIFEATQNGLSLIGVTLGTPGDDVTATGPVATRILNWGFSNFAATSRR